jgi:hypothetical protein
VLINCLKEAMVSGMIAEGLLGNRRNPGSYLLPLSRKRSKNDRFNVHIDLFEIGIVRANLRTFVWTNKTLDGAPKLIAFNTV